VRDVDPRLFSGMRRQLAARHADAELAVELGDDGAIARHAAALEIVDLAGDESPEEVGERLQSGDRLITGLIVNIPVASADEVVAEVGALGRVELRIA
jgi:hypothetical protein